MLYVLPPVAHACRYPQLAASSHVNTFSNIHNLSVEVAQCNGVYGPWLEFFANKCGTEVMAQYNGVYGPNLDFIANNDHKVANQISNWTTCSRLHVPPSLPTVKPGVQFYGAPILPTPSTPRRCAVCCSEPLQLCNRLLICQ